MILGFVSDAHGNPEGLRRCLVALRNAGAETIYFLGDAVGYLPDENAVMALLAENGAICIRGNHEEMLLGNLEVSPAREAVYRLAGARERLAPEWWSAIESWPIRRELDVEGARLLLVHGSPSDPVGGYIYPDTDLTPFRELPFAAVLMGQTHRPFVSSAGPVTVVNIGSSGMPRDVGNLASCATYDSVSRAWEILRVELDAAELLTRYGDRIDSSVAACLQRRPVEPVVGRVVAV